MENNPETSDKVVAGVLSFARLPLNIIAASAVCIIAARMVWRSLNFDNTSLILFAIASGALAIPYLLSLLPPLKSLEAGPVKAEFDRDIARLERNVEATESERLKQPTERAEVPGTVSWEKYFDEYFKIVNSANSNVEKILAAAILVERMLENVAKSLDLGDRLTARGIVDRLARENIIIAEEKKAFDEFWTLRNRVVHGAIGSPSNEQIARILDLVWRLVRTLA